MSLPLAEAPVEPRILLVGNPNAGKSTLFNALTRGRAQVGNFPGTTVARTEGIVTFDGGASATLVDLPGTFSLAAARPDERVAIDAILGIGGPGADLLLVVADGPRLMRSLYLVLQLLELGIPMVLAVNLMDEALADGLVLDLVSLEEALQIPVVGTVARRGEGIDLLREAVARGLAHGTAPSPAHPFTEALDRAAAHVAAHLPPELDRAVTDRAAPADAVARWLLLSADADGRVPGIADPVDAVVEARGDRDLAAELIATRYAWIDAREAIFLGGSMRGGAGWTSRIDAVVLHPVWGTAVFAVVMGLAFTALFSWADPLIGAVEAAFGWLGGGVAAGFDAAIARSPAVAAVLIVARDLVVDGLIGGVGAVVVFLPQIGLLFLFLALLEDCGYLARAAHLADRVLRAAGLPGRAFVPLLSGYACAVPAILATRTMPRFRDRLLTMMVLPLTSCSARLPVYTLLIAALFPATVAGFVPLRPVMLASMYLFSTAMAVGAAIVLGRTVFASGLEASLIELPPYRMPDPRVVGRQVWGRCVDFLREAGGIILIATVVLWGLLYFPRAEPADVLPDDVIASLTAQGADLEQAAAPLVLEQSFAGRLGRAIEPVIEPLGYDWKIGIGLVGAFAAREVFVSTMGVVYGVGADADEGSSALRDRIRADRRADGSPTYTPLVGMSIMVFFALSLQCLSTLAVLRKESGSWGWTALTFGWMSLLAWGAALVVFQGGRLLGLT